MAQSTRVSGTAPNGPKYTESTWASTQGRVSPCVGVSAAADLVCEAVWPPETISTARSQTISPSTVAGGGGGVVEPLISCLVPAPEGLEISGTRSHILCI